MSAFGSSKFGSGGDSGWVTLNLTALMDILSNLLFFLLASYNTQALELEANPKLTLPGSSSTTNVQKALEVKVTTEKVSVAGVPLADVKENAVVGKSDKDDTHPGIVKALKSLKGQRASKDIPDPEMLLLLADRNTDSTVIATVLKSAGTAGFVNVKFGVISR